MLITYTATKTFRISDVKGLDPITVYLDDHEPGRGTLTVRCFDEAWTCYWGAMGPGWNLARFIGSMDTEYIADNLVRGSRRPKRMPYVLRIAEAVKAAIAMGAAVPAAQVDVAREALSSISLCSQNSASSKEECGRLARAALSKIEESPL